MEFKISQLAISGLKVNRLDMYGEVCVLYHWGSHCSSYELIFTISLCRNSSRSRGLSILQELGSFKFDVRSMLCKFYSSSKLSSVLFLFQALSETQYLYYTIAIMFFGVFVYELCVKLMKNLNSTTVEIHGRDSPVVLDNS